MSSCGEFDHHLLEKYVVPPSVWPQTLAFGAPSPEEATIIHDDVRTAESRLSPLGAEIERAADVVNKLKCRRDEFSYYIAEHQALLAPMRRLPAELLSQIFSHYCNHGYSKEESRSTSFRKHPFTLAQVCRRWREVVLSTPAIWSKFRVEFDDYNMERCAAMTHAWLSKSGTCPLSLALEGRVYEVPTQGRHPMVDAIIPYCDRIKSLDLNIDAQILFAFMSKEGIFPVLQSIKINIPHSYGPDPPNTWRALENAPALRRVYFHNINHPKTAKLPWIQLTHLFFGNSVPIEPRKCLDLLQQCPNLESCVFLRIRVTSLNPSFVHTQVLHSSLRSLQVRARLNLSTFFDCLTLPALRDIHVAYDLGHPQFISLLERSRCRIERFVIDAQLTPRYFTQYFKNMPHLAELDIRAYTSSTSFRKLLQQLTLVGNSGDLCPGLRVLRLSNEPPLSSRDLINMVNSRNQRTQRPNAASIQTIHISLRKMTWDVLTDLKNVRNQGVELFITDSASKARVMTRY
jgi:hypothetical protein